MQMDRLVAQVIGWANDRNLIEGSTVEKQNVKLVEEFGEFAAGLARGKFDVQADALGDQLVILIIMAKQTNVDLLGKLVEFTGAEHRNYDGINGQITLNWYRIGVGAGFLTQTQNLGYLAQSIDDGEDITEALALYFGSCIAMCLELGLAPVKVLEDVWNIIKDRKGKMIDGVFVKEDDKMMKGSCNTQ